MHGSKNLSFDNGKSNHQTRVVGQADVPGANTELFTDSTPAIRPNNQRSSPIIVDDTDISQPNAVSKTCTHRLYRGLFACESHREKAHRKFAASKQLELLLHEQTPHEVLTESIVSCLDSRQLDDVCPNTKNHSLLIMIEHEPSIVSFR